MSTRQIPDIKSWRKLTNLKVKCVTSLPLASSNNLKYNIKIITNRFLKHACHWLNKQSPALNSRHWLSPCCCEGLVGMLNSNKTIKKKKENDTLHCTLLYFTFHNEMHHLIFWHEKCDEMLRKARILFNITLIVFGWEK